MAVRSTSGAGVAVITVLVSAAVCLGDEVRPPAVTWSAAAVEPGAEPAPIDPATFFQQLVDRYRDLEHYEDTASVEHITARDGQETQRTTTQITTVVEGDELDVHTPMSSFRNDLGLKFSGKAMEAIRRQYLIWLAPHMALRLTEQPLRQFRPGVDEGFTATGAEHVEMDSKPMVHLALRSSSDGTISEASRATFDLYVNPRSMLIERIEGQQTLADGAVMQTKVQITPIRASSANASHEDSSEPAIEESPASSDAIPAETGCNLPAIPVRLAAPPL